MKDRITVHTTSEAIITKFAGRCEYCDKYMPIGAVAVWFPRYRDIMHPECYKNLWQDYRIEKHNPVVQSVLLMAGYDPDPNWVIEEDEDD